MGAMPALKRGPRGFPGHPVGVKTSGFQCSRQRFDPWSGEPGSHMPRGVAKKRSLALYGGCWKQERGGEEQGGATAVYTEAGRTTDVHKVKGVDEDIPGGVDSKRRGTEMRPQEVFSDLEGSYNSWPGFCIWRGWFLSLDHGSNVVPEETDYWGLKLSGQSPWRQRAMRWARKEKHITESREEGRWISICKYVRTHTSASYAFKPQIDFHLPSPFVSMVTLAT